MSNANHKKFIREFYTLLTSVDQQTCGQVEVDTTQVQAFHDGSLFVIAVRPTDGLYKGVCCEFEIKVSPAYPECAPVVHCRTKLYHPNICYRSGRVCVSVLDRGWAQAVGLDGCVMSLLFLMYHPNLEDPLPGSAVDGCESPDLFQRNLHTALRGGSVRGFKFNRLVDDPEMEVDS